MFSVVAYSLDGSAVIEDAYWLWVDPLIGIKDIKRFTQSQPLNQYEPNSQY